MNTRIRAVVYIFLVVLAVIIFFFFLLQPSSEKVESVSIGMPKPLLLFVGGKIGDTIYPLSQGSGSLIDGTRGYIATAKHITDHLRDNPNYGLYAELDGKVIALEKVWEHKTADIAVVEFHKDERPAVLPPAFVVEKKLPIAGTTVAMRGYLLRSERVVGELCEKLQEKLFCTKNVPLTVYIPDAPMYAISPETDVDQIKLLLEMKAKNGGSALSYEDLFFNHHLTGALGASDRSKEYHGMSGGALVDERGHLLGIQRGGVADYGLILIVPSQEIPDKFLPKPSH